MLGNPAARLLTVVATGQFVLFGLLDILAVVLALELLGTGPAGPGLITSGIGVGALVGSALAVTLIGRTRMAPALLTGMVATGVAVATVAFAPGFVTAVLLFGAAGAGVAYFDVAARTLLQRTVPPRVLSRVFGVHEALLMAGTALGSAAVPILVLLLGIRGAFIASGAFLPAVGVFAWAWLRRLDRDAILPGPARPGPRPAPGSPTFAVLPQSQLEVLSVALQPTRHVTSGSAVITQGEPGDRYFVIRSGTAQVLRDGRQVALLGPGQGFGEIALLRDVPRTATVIAVGDLQVAALDRDPFLFAVTGSEANFRAVNDAVDLLLNDTPPPSEVTDPDGGVPLRGPVSPTAGGRVWRSSGARR